MTSPQRAGDTGTDRVTRVSLSTQIADRLRDDIVHGAIPAGTRLLQDEMCERFGTSRMPVRDALQQLTHEGLLADIGGQRVVVQLGRDDLADSHQLVSVMHGWAAGLAAQRATADDLIELKRLLDLALKEDDPSNFVRIAWDFHRTINRLSGSPRLRRAVLREQTSTPRVFPLAFPNQMVNTKRRYQEIYDAISSRDSESSERLARSYSIDFFGWIARLLDEHPPDGA